jgi:uncharacterized protein
MLPARTHPQKINREHKEKFHRGLEQFNAECFFEAHETWEEVWLASPEPDKTFLQGLIQIAAAFHHYRRGNLRGTRSLLKAALRRLAPFPATHGGIALEPVRSAAGQWAAALDADGDPGAARLPKIRRAHRCKVESETDGKT